MGRLTVFSTPWCAPCARLKRALDRAGVSYDDVDITKDATAAEIVTSFNGGNQTVPTVLFPDGTALTNPSVGQVVDRLRSGWPSPNGDDSVMG
jgi:mycoredoxin